MRAPLPARTRGPFLGAWQVVQLQGDRDPGGGLLVIQNGHAVAVQREREREHIRLLFLTWSEQLVVGRNPLWFCLFIFCSDAEGGAAVPEAVESSMATRGGRLGHGLGAVSVLV